MTAAKQPQAGRKQLLAKLQKAIKSQYKPVTANTGRSMLEQVLFACCLENAPHDVAEKAFARLLESYFDLNEIRVTTVAELAETLQELPDPSRAALALRRVLQGVFESTYSFSLDHAKKHSIAHGIKTLEHLHGIPPFVVQYVASTALGAHMIPLDLGALSGLYLTGVISREEYDAGKVAGLERFVAKKAGLEFSSQLHQFGSDVVSSLHGATVKKILQSVNPAAARERFPKRGEPLSPPNPPPPAAGKEGRRAAEAAQTAAEEHRPAGPQAAARPAGKTPLPPPGAGPKRAADGTAKAGAKGGPKPFVVKPNIGKAITIKPQAAAPAADVKPAGAKAVPAKAAGGQKPAAAAKPAKKVAGNGKVPAAAAKKSPGSDAKHKPRPPARPASEGKSTGKSHSSQLAKRKPR
jgi:endonuclease III